MPVHPDIPIASYDEDEGQPIVIKPVEWPSYN